MAQATVDQGIWCHVEIPSSDPAVAKAFYGEVFGWTFKDVPMPTGTYTLYETHEGGIGGGIWDPPAGMPRMMINYINVEEIEPVVESVEENGGQVLVPAQEVPGVGWFCIVGDPDGNPVGLWKQTEEKKVSPSTT